MLTRKQCKSQRRISSGSAFSPNGLMVSRPWVEHREYRTGGHSGTGTSGSRPACERLGKRNLYAMGSSIHRASSFDEPRTPVHLWRGVSGPVDNGPPLHLTSIGIPLTWLDNTRVYISFTTEPIGPLDRLGILDISRGPNQQMSDLTAVFQDKPTAPFNYRRQQLRWQHPLQCPVQWLLRAQLQRVVCPRHGV